MQVGITTRLATRLLPEEFMNIMEIGGHPVFNFDLNNEVYSFEDIEQVTFLFKQGDSDLYSYDAIDYPDPEAHAIWCFNEGFEYDELLNVIRFSMSPEDTYNFKPSKAKKRDTLVTFGVIVKVNSGDKIVVVNYHEDDIFVIRSIFTNCIEIN